MKVESLLIDIETILKMVRFVPSFRAYFEKNTYLESRDREELLKYVENANILSKEYLWEFCCVLEHIVEINKLITSWRDYTSDFKDIEENIKIRPEKEYTHDIIGRVIQSDKYTELIQEMRKNGFYYNGMVLLASNVINNDNKNSKLHFFY